MKNHTFILFIIFLLFGKSVFSQTEERFDIAGFTIPAGWVKETGNDFVAYTLNNPGKAEYARILIFKSLQGTGDVNADFDVEWKELVQHNYKPGAFINTNVSDYKDGWKAKVGVAPFSYQNTKHAALLMTHVKAKAKISYVFITNTTAYQTAFEDFGSSLNYGALAGSIAQQVPVQQNKVQQPEQQQSVIQQNTQAPPPQNRPAVSQSSGFQFTTSNFDDGWTASVQNDWVLVTKGIARIYLYFAVPYNADNFSGTGVMDRDYYWDNYIAKQFRTTTKLYNDAGEYVSSFKPKYVEGVGSDPTTGAPVFIGMTLTVGPNSAQMTVAAFPDEASFRQAFPKANDRYTSDLTAMSRYNKFAIGQADFVGTWQSGGSQMTQWYDAITGNYAGATIASSSATFSFFNNGTYSSIQNGATGAVGAMNTFQQEYKGNNTVSNWNMRLSNRWQEKTQTFDAHYQAVKGGRLLYLNNNAGENYLLVKIR